ncbi:hypothetical protein [Thalassotalea profundi]|uniref:VWA domain-containing protein n=1 Tax=Thalassotalea profundi TaxID=2036687 RepID=A0ABQ3IPB3_9GAMM|nr:hypothetical protein [Thalassotalea profundi]GHE90383.1 hypothetical protein GCM10011501_19720 [Thalassotalea profundi]
MMLFGSNWLFASFSTLHYVIFAFSVVFLVITCVKVWQRYQGKSAFISSLLCLVNTCAVITMLLLILPIYQQNQVSQQAIVITNNCDEQLLQQAVERYRLGDIETFFVLVDAPEQRERLQGYFKQEKMLPDLVWLTSSYQLQNYHLGKSLSNRQHLENKLKFKALYVYGDGFTKEQLTHLDSATSSLRLYYFPSKPMLGVVDVKWSQEVLLGANTSVSGTLQSSNMNSLYLVELVDVNNDILVQASLRANERFYFEFVPKATGINKYWLNIREKSSDKLLVQETIQLNVILGDKLNILVQTASPSFEIRHLKNWLAEQGSQLTLISQTSKNAHLTQTINTEQQAKTTIDYLSLENLANVDLLILDSRSVVAFSQIQQQEVMSAIKKGLAVFVFIDDALIKPHQPNALINFFQTFTSFQSETDININKPTGIYLQHNTGSSANERVLIPSNIRLNNKHGDNLVINAEKQPLVLSQAYGFGSVTLSAINSSYQWKLSGLDNDYGQYWQYLLGLLIHSQDSLSWMSKAHKPILFPLESTRLCYRNEGESIRVEQRAVFNSNINSDKASNNATTPATPLVANKLIEREHHYCIDWLITTSGWHKLSLIASDITKTMDADIANSVETFIYVSEANQWLALQQISKRRATKLKALPNQSNEHTNEDPTINTLNYIKVPFNKWPIWIVFISCCTLLWIERKIA